MQPRTQSVLASDLRRFDQYDDQEARQELLRPPSAFSNLGKTGRLANGG